MICEPLLSNQRIRRNIRSTAGSLRTTQPLNVYVWPGATSNHWYTS
jgi:capsular polysaccharide biosynthesis protein